MIDDHAYSELFTGLCEQHWSDRGQSVLLLVQHNICTISIIIYFVHVIPYLRVNRSCYFWIPLWGINLSLLYLSRSQSTRSESLDCSVIDDNLYRDPGYGNPLNDRKESISDSLMDGAKSKNALSQLYNPDLSYGPGLFRSSDFDLSFSQQSFSSPDSSRRFDAG